jgi:hypothetical protein
LSPSTSIFPPPKSKLLWQRGLEQTIIGIGKPPFDSSLSDRCDWL